MAETFTKTIEVGDDLAECSRVQEELSGFWEEHGLPEEIETAVSLALEEALSNVLRHSVSVGRPKEIRVTFDARATGFSFEVSDGAMAYNPLARPGPDVARPLAERRPGGLGVFLVKRLADEVTYEHRDGRNHLRFLKRFGGEG